MIVKNSPDGNLWRSQQHSHVAKPLFLQGFEYARNLLLELRKAKTNHIQFSPMTKEKFTHYDDIILEEQQIFNNQRSKNCLVLQRENERIRLSSELESDNDELSLETIKVKTKNPNELDKEHNFGIERKQKSKLEVEKRQKTQEIEEEKGFKNYENLINEIGSELEQVNNEIEIYQIVFANLCDCYKANRSIVTINEKFTRESLAIAQEKERIVEKIKALEKESIELDSIEKMCNEHIAKCVERYIEEVHMYNKCEEISIPGLPSIEERNYGKDIEDEEEDDYEQPLNLNFKRMKELNEDKIKKKVLLEPKKLQKGVSFEEEIDVISKYYEAELSNI